MTDEDVDIVEKFEKMGFEIEPHIENYVDPDDWAFADVIDENGNVLEHMENPDAHTEG